MCECIFQVSATPTNTSPSSAQGASGVALESSAAAATMRSESASGAVAVKSVTDEVETTEEEPGKELED